MEESRGTCGITETDIEIQAEDINTMKKAGTLLYLVPLTTEAVQ